MAVSLPIKRVRASSRECVWAVRRVRCWCERDLNISISLRVRLNLWNCIGFQLHLIFAIGRYCSLKYSAPNLTDVEWFCRVRLGASCGLERHMASPTSVNKYCRTVSAWKFQKASVSRIRGTAKTTSKAQRMAPPTSADGVTPMITGTNKKKRTSSGERYYTLFQVFRPCNGWSANLRLRITCLLDMLEYAKQRSIGT